MFRIKLSITLLTITVFLIPSIVNAQIKYTDIDATAGGDGSSWSNAYRYLQDALKTASSGDQIWVAQGIYYPDEGDNITDNERNESFHIPDKVKVYGGFSGKESDISQRDILKNGTILSGDLRQDDESLGNNDNAYHVVYFINASEQTILDGFTITAGNAQLDANDILTNTDNGGGILNDGSGSISRPQIINCTIKGNYARLGGGMFNDGSSAGLSSPTIINCFITNNSATFGGGICNHGYEGNSSPFLTNCIISDNTASFAAGGIYNHGRAGGESSPTLINCIISGNINTGSRSGGIDNNGADNGNSSPTLINCIINGNKVTGMGGGIYNSANNGGKCITVLENCIICGNYADNGSGIYNRGSDILGIGQCSPNLTNCIVWGNFKSDSQIFNETASPSYSYCDIEGGVSGIGNIEKDPLFAKPGYWANINDPAIKVQPNNTNAMWVNGDYHLKSEAGRWDPNSGSWIQDDATSPCIDAGDLNSLVAFEPFPNGGIINMGAYGGTDEASRSPSGLHAKYGGGTGDPNNPYLIYTSEQLNTIGAEPNDWDKHFKLMADIDLSEYSYDDALIGPDGDSNDPAFQGTSFTGVLDGNGHAISNLTITGQSYLGIFGRTEYQAQIKNLSIVDVNITGTDYIGGLIGFNNGSITTCRTAGFISGNNRVGGIAGRNWGSINASLNEAAVTGYNDVGGLTAGNYGRITDSYNTGAVSSNSDVGGLVGENYGTIDKCYSTGAVSGERTFGGFVSFNWENAIITSSFWDMETSGQTSSTSGTGKTTAEMQTASTFLGAGWDFVGETENGIEDIWWIDEGQDYPRLWWEDAEQ